MPEFRNEKTYMKSLKSNKYALLKGCEAKCAYTFVPGHKFCPYCGEAITVSEVETITDVESEVKE